MRPPAVFVRELLARGGRAVEVVSKPANSRPARAGDDRVGLGDGDAGSADRRARGTDASHVRKVIHAFNEEGFGSLDPDYRGGRPKKMTPAERDRIVAVARTRPDHQGVPLTCWSLPKLAQHLAGMGIVLCAKALRQGLA